MKKGEENERKLNKSRKRRQIGEHSSSRSKRKKGGQETVLMRGENRKEAKIKKSQVNGVEAG